MLNLVVLFFHFLLYSALVSEDNAKLRRVGFNGGEELPSAGLEPFGDGAVSSEGDPVVGGGHRTELENRNGGVWRARDLDGAVHAGNLGGFTCTIGFQLNRRRRVGVWWFGF